MDAPQHSAALQDEFMQHSEEILAAVWSCPTALSLQQEAASLLPKFQGLEIIVLLPGMC